MYMTISRIIAALCVCVAASAAQSADEYPTKPVRVIAPSGPGSTTDFTARTISQQLTEQLGKSFIVDNRGGADSGPFTVGVFLSPDTRIDPATSLTLARVAGRNEFPRGPTSHRPGPMLS